MREIRKAALKVREVPLHLKAANDDGTFSGYGSVFDVADFYNEIVARGAFSESLAEIAEKGRPLPVLWQHRADMPIGVYESLAEDETGLRVEGRLLKDDVRQAAETHALVRAGAVSGLSIGFYVRESNFDEKTKIRTLTKLDLVEISLVTFPANDEARVDTIKMKLARGSLPTLPEFENLLREAGFSKTQAAVVANRGLAHLLRSESEGLEAKSAAVTGLLSRLDGFSLPSF
jgi:HK97 family phage prohead protease